MCTLLITCSLNIDLAGECGMIVGPHSTKLPQSWDTGSDQPSVPASEDSNRLRWEPDTKQLWYSIRLSWEPEFFCHISKFMTHVPGSVSGPLFRNWWCSFTSPHYDRIYISHSVCVCDRVVREVAVGETACVCVCVYVCGCWRRRRAKAARAQRRRRGTWQPQQ